jgi:hypothetical protein
VLVCVLLGGASSATGQEIESPLFLEGVVLEGDSGVDSATVFLHRVSPDEAGEVGSARVGSAGEFQFLLPSLPNVDAEDVYFASVEYEGVLYFGSAITTVEQLDSLYVIRIYRAEEVPPEGVSLPIEVRNMFLEFTGEAWFATDLLVIANRGSRTLVAGEDGVVWSYPLPPGFTEPELGESDLPPDAVTFDAGRVRVSAPIPPGDRVLMIRYRLEELGSSIPAPGSTELFELLVREPAPPLEVVGLSPLDVVGLNGSSYRRYGGSELVDIVLTLIETEAQSPPPVKWLAVLASMMLALGGFLAYNRPRRRGAVAQAPGLGREALILEVARVDDALSGAAEPEVRSELLGRRAALLAMLQADD